MSHFSNIDIQRQNLIKEIDNLCESCFKSIAQEYDITIEDVSEIITLRAEDTKYINENPYGEVNR